MKRVVVRTVLCLYIAQQYSNNNVRSGRVNERERERERDIAKWEEEEERVSKSEREALRVVVYIYAFKMHFPRSSADSTRPIRYIRRYIPTVRVCMYGNSRQSIRFSRLSSQTRVFHLQHSRASNGGSSEEVLTYVVIVVVVPVGSQSIRAPHSVRMRLRGSASVISSGGKEREREREAKKKSERTSWISFSYLRPRRRARCNVGRKQ